MEARFIYYGNDEGWYTPYQFVFGMIEGDLSNRQTAILFGPVEAWCENQFGRQGLFSPINGSGWLARWKQKRKTPARWTWLNKKHVVLFSQENDAFEFRMRWC